MALTKVSLVDLNAGELILDLDADTSITSDTDDTIHFKIGGSDEITITGTALSPSTSDGNALGTAALEWSDLFLADGAVINFGDDQDVSLTHVADTGLLLSSTDKLMFNDASQFIQGASATVLDIAATDEIELTSTLIDVVGNLAVSGTIVGAGALTAATSITVGSAVLTEAELETLDGVTVGTAIASKVVTTDANIDTTGQRNLTISGELDAATGDFSGDVDIDGTANLDVVDIDGATQIDATVTVGVDDTGYDVKFFGDTSGAHMLWDASVDDLILAGAGRLVVPEGNLVLGSTAVTSTAAELNLLDGVSGLVQADLTKLAAIDATATEINFIDGGATVGTTAVADGDGIIHNDGGTMKVTSAATFKTYFQEGISTAYDDLTTGDAAVLITTSSGNITIDAAADDSDIILKGTDGGADTTFLTIDGSAAGEATFNAGVIAPALTIDDVAVDGKVITMTGSSGDTFVTTVAANGATSLVTTDAGGATAHLQITADGTVDIDGTVITLDSVGDIVLDAGGADVKIKDDGTEFLKLGNSSSDAVIEASVQDKDILFKGNDGGAAVTALTLDMSAAGKALFNAGLSAGGDITMSTHEILFADNGQARFGTGEDLKIYHDGSNSYIEDTGTGDLKVRSNKFYVDNADSSKDMAIFTDGGACDFYHNNLRMAVTTAYGLEIGAGRASDTTTIGFKGNAANWNIGIDDSLDLLVMNSGALGDVDDVGGFAIDANGRFRFDHKANSISPGNDAAHFQIAKYNASTTALIGCGALNTSAGGQAYFYKSRNATPGGAFTIVQDNDSLGSLVWAADDGTDATSISGRIEFVIGAAPGTNDVPGRLKIFVTADGAQTPTERFRINYNGDITATDTSIGSLSDERLKDNIADYTYALSDFKNLRPRSFEWKNPKEHSGTGTKRGFVAQEVGAVDSLYTDTYVMDEDGDDYGIIHNADGSLKDDSAGMAQTAKLGYKDAMYVSVIKQLISKIETLETKVQALEDA